MVVRKSDSLTTITTDPLSWGHASFGHKAYSDMISFPLSPPGFEIKATVTKLFPVLDSQKLREHPHCRHPKACSLFRMTKKGPETESTQSSSMDR